MSVMRDIFGGGGDDGTAAMARAQIQALQDEQNRAKAQNDKVEAENNLAAATAEEQRKQRLMGMGAFTTNGYVGYTKTLGGGNAVTV